MISGALAGYVSIVNDFDQVTEPFKEAEVKILISVRNAFTALQRLSPPQN